MMDEDELADLFSAFGPVRSRRMFGGAGLYADGVMFAIDTGQGIFLKTDPAFAADLAERGCAPFTYSAKEREVRLPYWSLPEEALDAPDLLAELARRALGIARASAAKKKPKEKKPAK